MADKIHTVESVAALLGLVETTVRNKINAGEIPAYKFGGRWYIFESELFQAIKKQGRKKGQ